MLWVKQGPGFYTHSSGLVRLRRIANIEPRAGCRRIRSCDAWRWAIDLSDQRGEWHQHATYSNVSHAKTGAVRLMASDDFWQG